MNYGLISLIKSCSVLGLLTALTVSAHAKVITTCGESNGYGAYLRNGNLGPQVILKRMVLAEVKSSLKQTRMLILEKPRWTLFFIILENHIEQVRTAGFI